MRVLTESGNEYILEHGIPTLSAFAETYASLTKSLEMVSWKAKEPRGHDEDGSAHGIVSSGPTVGESMVLIWAHPKRGLQLRVTSRVVAVIYE